MHDVSNKWTNNVTWHVCCLKLIHHTVRCKTAGCIELWISRSCMSTHPSLFNSYTCDRSPGRSLHKLVLYGCVWIHKRCSSMKGAHKDGESGHTWPDSPTHTHTHTHRSSGAGVQPDGFISRLWQTDAPTETITSCLPFGSPEAAQILQAGSLWSVMSYLSMASSFASSSFCRTITAMIIFLSSSVRWLRSGCSGMELCAVVGRGPPRGPTEADIIYPCMIGAQSQLCKPLFRT